MSEINENDSTTSTKSVLSNVAADCLGKVLVKAQFKEDIRRVPIHNEDITYDELVLMMQRVFRGQLKQDDDIVIKYQDEDGDMVTIFDSADLSFAITYCRVLRLKIIVKEKAKDSKEDVVAQLKNIGIREIRQELKELRDRANRLLDILDAEVENKNVVDKSNSSADVEKSADNKLKLNGPSSFIGNEQQSSLGGQPQQQHHGVPNTAQTGNQQSMLNQQPSLPSSGPSHSLPQLNQQHSSNVAGTLQQHSQPQPQPSNLQHHTQGPPLPNQGQMLSGNVQHSTISSGHPQQPGIPGQQLPPLPASAGLSANAPQIPPPSGGQQLPPSGGHPQSVMQSGGGYPPSSPSNFPNYQSGYSNQGQYMVGYPATSAASYSRPGPPQTGVPPPTGAPPAGSQPPPPMQQSQQQPSQQPSHQTPQQQSFQSYQQNPSAVGMPPISAPSMDQSYHPPPPGSNASYNQYRIPTTGQTTGNMYARPQTQMGYK
ncbi:unnamed protein product [Allacma fusca]|uniref:PB1 domain-containing protein n=1 Tax=Allacma fusca TaxID=39272 RepID=A0A8J2PP14_9HEXA|nr:unnamed protein product [Allacma fusca]